MSSKTISDNIGTMLLFGVVPEPPFVLAKNIGAANLIQAAIHTHLSHEPPVVIYEGEWTLDVPAVVVTPLGIIGETEPLSFAMPGIENLKEDTRRALIFWMQFKMSHDGANPTIRDVSTAIYGEGNRSSKRQADYIIRELVEAGFLVRTGERGEYQTCFGSWKPSPAVAKSMGLEVKDRRIK